MAIDFDSWREVQRRFDTILMLHKYGTYLNLRMFKGRNEAKVLFYPGAPHSIVSSKWSKLVSKKEYPLTTTITIRGFQQPLYSKATCHLHFQGDGNTKFSVTAYVVDEIQDGIDVVLGYAFEKYARLRKVERNANNIRCYISQRHPNRKFHVVMEGTVLPEQDMKLPLRLPDFLHGVDNQ